MDIPRGPGHWDWGWVTLEGDEMSFGRAEPLTPHSYGTDRSRAASIAGLRNYGLGVRPSICPRPYACGSTPSRDLAPAGEDGKAGPFFGSQGPERAGVPVTIYRLDKVDFAEAVANVVATNEKRTPALGSSLEFGRAAHAVSSDNPWHCRGEAGGIAGWPEKAPSWARPSIPFLGASQVLGNPESLEGSEVSPTLRALEEK